MKRYVMILSLLYCSTARAAPEVSLLIMSPGDDLFARFGHAALLVEDGRGSRVYNYGMTRFSRFSTLVADFLRGKARFWVSTSSLAMTLRTYRRDGRSVLLYPLRMSNAKHTKLAELLRNNCLPENRYYIYHHFKDNCATRLRDLLNRVLDGRPRAILQKKKLALTYRQLARRGFGDEPAILLVAELFVGRSTDRPLNAWQAGFLPDLLVAGFRDHVGVDDHALLGAPQTLLEATAPSGDRGDPHTALSLLWSVAGLLLLLGLLGWWTTRRRQRWSGFFFLWSGLLFGLLSTILWAVAAITTLPEFHDNETLLFLLPSDWVLVGLAVRLMRGRFIAGRLIRAYLHFRLGLSALLLLLRLVGVLIQSPVVLLMAIVALAPLWLAVRDLPRPSESDADPVRSV